MIMLNWREGLPPPQKAAYDLLSLDCQLHHVLSIDSYYTSF